VESEKALFEKLREGLNAGTPLRDLELSKEEEKGLTGYTLLTLKPVMVLLNLSEGQTPPEVDYPHARGNVEWLQGKLEMELAQLPEEEADLFKAEFGIQELGMQRIVRRSDGKSAERNRFPLPCTSHPALVPPATRGSIRGAPEFFPALPGPSPVLLSQP
jgi:ribosome-binding ATPase YchF (GTP1/OBG family)